MYYWYQGLYFFQIVFIILKNGGYTCIDNLEWIFEMYSNHHSDHYLDPKAWESYFKNILRKHYQPSNFCDVPDSHCGDFGIECYTLDGHVFQCYLPDQSSDLEKLYNAQRNKIAKDISKFSVQNVAEFEKLFGAVKISRWILATPYNKSAKLAQYCTTKSLEVRNLNLSYVSDDFQIIIQTDDDYPQEKLSLHRDSYFINLEVSDEAVNRLRKMISDNATFFDKLNLKLPKITSSPEQQDSYRLFLTEKYIEYRNLLDTLMRDWVEIYHIVFRCIKEREDNIVGIFLLSSSDTQPSEIMKGQIESLRQCIMDEIITLKNSDLEKITWGVISDWLIRCPLAF